MTASNSLFASVTRSVRRQMPALVLISCFVNLLLLVTSIYMLQIYDRVLSSGSLDTLLWLTVVAIAAIAFYGLLEHSRRVILSRTAGFIDHELASPVLEQSMLANLAGETPKAGIRDVSDLRNFYRTDAILAFFDAPWSVVFIAFVWLLHPTLGMIVLAGAITLFGATLLNDLMTRRRQQDAATAMREANEAAIRYVEGGETISPLGMGQAIFSRWRMWQDKARQEQSALGEKTTTILSFTRSLRMALQIAVLGAGAYYVIGGQITAGAMIAASIIASRALAPIERLTAAWHKHVAAKMARRALSAMFDGLAVQTDRTELPRPEGSLRVEELTMFAPGTRTPLLQNVQFALDPGEVCAVIGPSGAGKSTLCRTLVGAWKPAVGCVRLDHTDVSGWDAHELGAYLGYLPQKVELFPGTVAENIGRFGPIDSEAVLEAAQLAGADEVIRRLPKGYETQVGPGGENISLGQRQRIGLARAVFGNPAFVVLDEPNAHLDSAGDKALVSALERLKAKGTTIIVVSHRSQVLKAVDKVLVLRDGVVSDFRDRDEVLRPVQRTERPGKTMSEKSATSSPTAPKVRRAVAIKPKQKP